jgi:hypothetical protein
MKGECKGGKWIEIRHVKSLLDVVISWIMHDLMFLDEEEVRFLLKIKLIGCDRDENEEFWIQMIDGEKASPKLMKSWVWLWVQLCAFKDKTEIMKMEVSLRG